MAGQRTYEYTLRDPRGKLVKGRIEASTEVAVANRLRSMGVAPLSISEVQTSGMQREIRLPGGSAPVKVKDLSIMGRQLATMVSAGLSLVRALGILSEQTENKELSKVLGTIRSDIETGSSLSDSLSRHPTVFPPLMLNMVRAGEMGGFLEQALVSVAENFEAEVRLKAKIKSAMTYPVVVLVIAILAVVGMLLFIVPVFEDMFAGLGGELPMATQVLVTMSSVMKVVAIPLVVVVVVFVVWWRTHKNDEPVREFLDPIKLKTPVFGSLFQKVAVARFTRNFGTMLRAGVPILQSLDIVGETSGNVVIAHAIKDVQVSVRAGNALTAPLSQHRVFPPMVVQMMTVGEDTGALDEMLEKIAQFYDQEVEATTEQLTSIIEPLMIAFLGIIVGSMIVALYMPIFSVFDLVG